MKRGEKVVFTRDPDEESRWEIQADRPVTEEDVDGVLWHYSTQGFDVIVATIADLTDNIVLLKS